MDKLTTTQVLELVKLETGIALERPRFLRGVRTGHFPKPARRFTSKALFWDRADILEWLRRDDSPKPAQPAPRQKRTLRVRN